MKEKISYALIIYIVIVVVGGIAMKIGWEATQSALVGIVFIGAIIYFGYFLVNK